MDIRGSRFSKPIAAIHPVDYGPAPVQAGRPCLSHAPTNFVRVEKRKCSCGKKVAFLHRWHWLCLACCVREGLLCEPIEEPRRGESDPACDGDDLAKRIETAHMIRRIAGPDGSIMAQLEQAMDGGSGKSRADFKAAGTGEKIGSQVDS